MRCVTVENESAIVDRAYVMRSDKVKWCASGFTIARYQNSDKGDLALMQRVTTIRYMYLGQIVGDVSGRTYEVHVQGMYARKKTECSAIRTSGRLPSSGFLVCF